MSNHSKCPYCGAQIDYKRRMRYVKDKGRNAKCIKCGKIMRVSYKRAAAFIGIIFFVVLVAMNTFYMFFTKNSTIIPNLIMTVLFILLYMALVPAMVRFRKIAGQEEEPPKLKKNRHRHKKEKNNKIEINENPLKNTTFDN